MKTGEPSLPQRADVSKRRRHRFSPLRAVRAVFDLSAWRTVGSDEFAFMWLGISRLPGGRLAMRAVIGGIAILMFPLAIVMVWHPLGPPDALHTAMYVGALVCSVVLGLWWIFDPKPSWRHALYFVAWSDLLILIGTASLAASASRICGTIYLGMIALLTAMLLGWRILMIHCLFSLSVIGTYVAIGILTEGETLLSLYVFVAPAVTMEVGLPALMQVIVELSRHGMGQIFTERNRDALTGLYSRQGIRLALRALLRTRRRDVCVVAMIDLDSFKRFNDTYGHPAGDELLASTARRLRAEIDDALIARVGGDEFLLYAMRSSRYGADTVTRSLRRLVTGGDGTEPIGASVGAVVVEHPDTASLNAAVTLADSALYEAKRGRNDRIVVREPEASTA